MKFKMLFQFLLFCLTFIFVPFCTAIDVTTLPTSTSNISKSTVDLPRSVPSFLYQVCVNNYFYLSCTPNTNYDRFNAETEVKASQNESNETSISYPFKNSDPLYVHRQEADVGFAGKQQLRLLQKQFFKWETAGNNFSLTAIYRERQMRKRGVIESGLFEEKKEINYPVYKDDIKIPLYVCRSGSDPFKLGLLSMIDGICRVLKLPRDGIYQNWTFHTEYEEPIQVAIKLRSDLNYTWLEVDPSKASSGEWHAPPNAVEVDVGGYGRDHLPLYFARLTVNASFTTVIGLFSDTKLPIDSNKGAKLELLVVDEVLFQVHLRLSGRVNPVNVLANKWEETLNCKLETNKSTLCSSFDAGVVTLVDLTMDNSGAALAAFSGRKGEGKQNRATSWKIFRKSTSESPYWGAGHGGSLFADDAAFVGAPRTNFRENAHNRLPRHLCRINFGGPDRHWIDHWRAGFLDHEKGACIVSTNWLTSKDANYELLYNGEQSSSKKKRLVWRPYRQERAQQLGAITAGWERESQDLRMFFARLESFTDKDNQTYSLYGTITGGSDKFYYQDGEYVDWAKEIENAEAAGVQVLALED